MKESINNIKKYIEVAKLIKTAHLFVFLFLFVMLSSVYSLNASAVESYQAPKISNNKPIRATANEIIIDRNLNRATLLKNAKIVQKPIILEAEKIVIDYLEKKTTQESDQSQLKEIRAYKNVELTTDKMYVTSDEGIYNAKNGILILSGNVVAIEGQTKAQGDKFIYNINTGESRIKSTLQTEGGDGTDILNTEGKDGRVIIILEEERIDNHKNKNKEE